MGLLQISQYFQIFKMRNKLSFINIKGFFYKRGVIDDNVESLRLLNFFFFACQKGPRRSDRFGLILCFKWIVLYQLWYMWPFHTEVKWWFHILRKRLDRQKRFCTYFYPLYRIIEEKIRKRETTVRCFPCWLFRAM